MNAKKQAENASNSHILTEDVITLKDVAALLPTRPCFATIWRWSKRGLKGLKLETYRIGQQHLTSKQAVHRFLEKTQG